MLAFGWRKGSEEKGAGQVTGGHSPSGDQLRLWGGGREVVRWGWLLTEHRQGIAHQKHLARLKNSPTEKFWKLPLNKFS